jgi:hypothetical protein
LYRTAPAPIVARAAETAIGDGADLLRLIRDLSTLRRGGQQIDEAVDV